MQHWAFPSVAINMFAANLSAFLSQLMGTVLLSSFKVTTLDLRECSSSSHAAESELCWPCPNRKKNKGNQSQSALKGGLLSLGQLSKSTVVCEYWLLISWGGRFGVCLDPPFLTKPSRCKLTKTLCLLSIESSVASILFITAYDTRAFSLLARPLKRHGDL